MAADPHTEIGYEPREAAPKVELPKCRTCGEPTAILHSIAPDIRRLHCGECQGKANR